MAGTVLITGASKGIGKATAEHFAKNGWRVYAAVRDMRGVHFTHPEITVIQMDVDSPGSIMRAFHLLKTKIDVLVNNAGFGLYGPFESYSEHELEHQFKTNVLGVARVSRAALPLMQPNGVLINVSSVAGRIGMPYYSLYSSSKFAVEGLTEALHYELASRPIRVKLVAPSTVRTNFFNTRAAAPTHTAQGKALTAFYEQQFSQGDEADTIAKLIYRAATDGSTKLFYAPKRAHAALLLKRLLPANTFAALAKRYIPGCRR